MPGWWLFGWLWTIWQRFVLRHPYGRKKTHDPAFLRYGRFRKKPKWVQIELIRLKALMPDTGCRKLADIFNRRFAHKHITVGKTYVSGVIRTHQYEIQVMRRQVRNRKLKPGTSNRIWGLDLTGKTDSTRHTHQILGIVDHGSRANLTLVGLRTKATISILRVLLNVIEQFGKPKRLRTDNEVIFTSRLFRFGLWALGIRHQRTDLHCPWQNGRVERFFGSLKAKLDHWTVDNLDQLNTALHAFRLWYNRVRPHQHLQGQTPAEVWDGVDIQRQPPKKAVWFSEWGGLLTGYYLQLLICS